MKQRSTTEGKISDHLNGLGTVTAEMVRERAREIAQINGRDPGTFTQADWAEAKRELTGTDSDAAEDENFEIHGVKEWNEVPSTSGHKAPVRGASDEQTFAEKLAEQGVEEANHDQMLKGARSDINQS
jgi:hypothetical protein